MDKLYDELKHTNYPSGLYWGFFDGRAPVIRGEKERYRETEYVNLFLNKLTVSIINLKLILPIQVRSVRPLHPLRPRGRLRPQCQHRRLSRRQRGHAEAVQGGGRQRGYVAGAAQDPQVGGLRESEFRFHLQVKCL